MIHYHKFLFAKLFSLTSVQDFQFSLANQCSNGHFHFNLICRRHFLQSNHESGSPRLNFGQLLRVRAVRLDCTLWQFTPINPNIRSSIWMACSAFAYIYGGGTVRGGQCILLWLKWCDGTQKIAVRFQRDVASKIHVGRELHAIWIFFLDQSPAGIVFFSNGWFVVGGTTMVLGEMFVQLEIACVFLLAFGALEFRLLRAVLALPVPVQVRWVKEYFTALITDDVLWTFTDCRTERNHILQIR